MLAKKNVCSLIVKYNLILWLLKKSGDESNECCVEIKCALIR